MSDAARPNEAFLRLLDPDPQCAALKFRRLFAHLSRWLEWKGCGDPEAAAAEAVLRAVRQLDRFSGKSEGDLRALLFGIAANVALEFGRRRGREQQLAPTDWATRSAGVSEENRVIARLTIEKIRECIGDNDWQVIHAYATEDDRAQLRQQLGVTPEALRIKIHRIRRKIRECLNSAKKGEA